MPSSDTHVAAGVDDGFVRADAYINDDDAVVWVGRNEGEGGGAYHCWYRFTGITIPVGATIITAHLTVTKDGQYGDVLTRLYADDAADPANPSSLADYNGRTLTTNFVDWDSPDIGGGSGTVDSPDLKDVIQELVNSYNYSAGSHILILHRDDGSGDETAARILARDWNEADSAQLYIEWSVASRVPQHGVVVFQDPAVV